MQLKRKEQVSNSMYIIFDVGFTMQLDSMLFWSVKTNELLSFDVVNIVGLTSPIWCYCAAILSSKVYYSLLFWNSLISGFY